MLNRVFGPFVTQGFQGFQLSRAQVYSFPLDLTGDAMIIMHYALLVLMYMLVSLYPFLQN